MELLDIYTLSNIKGLGDKSIIKIINFCKTNNIKKLEELRNSVIARLLVKNYATILINALKNLYVLKYNSQEEINKFKDENIYAISILDKKYPKLLKATTNPPVILYCKGNISLLNNSSIAVIGTRENTKIGKKITERTVEFLIKNNFTIISGLALGIDTIAHLRTLDLRGKTIAVLASIVNIQPTSNIKLANDILENNGLLISEQKPKTRYHPSQLVKRDRIQSGLSISLFAIETKIDGGTMNAINDSIKHNRIVYTPDIFGFKQTYLSHKQTQGILKLQKEGLSKKYTSEDYQKILKTINSYKIDNIKNRNLFCL